MPEKCQLDKFKMADLQPLLPLIFVISGKQWKIAGPLLQKHV